MFQILDFIIEEQASAALQILHHVLTALGCRTALLRIAVSIASLTAQHMVGICPRCKAPYVCYIRRHHWTPTYAPPDVNTEIFSSAAEISIAYMQAGFPRPTCGLCKQPETLFLTTKEGKMSIKIQSIRNFKRWTLKRLLGGPMAFLAGEQAPREKLRPKHGNSCCIRHCR